MTVDRWSGRETRLLRHALRLTVRAFAEDLGVCVRTVSKWEAAGAGLIPRPEIQAALDTMLSRAGEDDRQRFRAARPPVVPSAPEIEDRAQPAGPAEPGVRAEAPELPVDPEHLNAALDDARRYLDRAVVAHFRDQLVRIKADDGRCGAVAVLPRLLGTLGAVQRHAGQVRPDVRKQLLKAGADGAEFAGWLYRDLNDTARAVFWHDRATEWAQEAGDAAMQGYVLLKKAQLAYDGREPLRMLTLSQAVRSGPWRLPLRVQAEATQQEARAEAMLGASTDAVRRRLDQAQHLLHRGDDAEPPALGAHYNQTLLTMQTAACHAEAGRPEQALELYRASLDATSFSPRDYSFFLSWMAGAQARAGQPDEAAATGLASAAGAARAGSGRTRRELGRVLHTLRPWQQRPSVRELAAAVAGG